MADNLTVTIGADSSKLRAELALVSQATKAAQKELNTLAAAFNKTGADADRMRLDAKARQLDQYKRSAASLNQQIAALSPTLNRVGASAEHAASGLQEFIHQGRGLGRVVSEFSNLSRGLESFTGIFGRLTGGFAGGLLGVGIARGFTALYEQINKVSEALGELRKTGAEIGLKPIEVQAARKVVEGIGEDADVATKALQGMSEAFAQLRKESPQRLGDAVPVLRGGRGMGMSGQDIPGVRVLRAGQQPDLSKTPLEILGIANALKALPNTELGKLKSFEITLKAFQDQADKFDPTALNQIISMPLFKGVPAETMLKAAPALLRMWEEEIARLQKRASGATAEQLAQDEALRISKNRLSDAYGDMAAVVANSLTPAQTGFNNLLARAFDRATINLRAYDKELTESVHSWAGIPEAWQQAMSDIEKQSSATWRAFVDATQGAADAFKSIWDGAISAVAGLWTSLSDTISGVFNSIMGWLGKIGSAIGSAASAAGSIDASLGVGLAAGGMVRGAGNGTSDSILARLSNGEFVMRAEAVRHWGSDLMASLNGLRNPGFALGGLVGSLPQFAAGGAVGGGSTVHLHLGGNSYVMSASESVASALVHEAHRQQMRSAGTKPSWFAARPSGR
jgi:hypothetical protein